MLLYHRSFLVFIKQLKIFVIRHHAKIDKAIKVFCSTAKEDDQGHTAY